MTWDGGLFIVILLALSPSYSLFSFTGSMPWTVTEWSQPSSVFSVRSKRRRVSFYFTPYCVLHSAQIVAVLRYSASFPDSPAPSYRYNGATHNCIDSIYCQVLNTHCVCVCVCYVCFSVVCSGLVFTVSSTYFWLPSRLCSDQLKLFLVD